MFMTEGKPINVLPTQMIITRRGECNALKERRMRVFSEAQFPAPKFGVLAVSPPPPLPKGFSSDANTHLGIQQAMYMIVSVCGGERMTITVKMVCPHVAIERS